MQLGKAIILLLLTIQQSCLALYIKNVEKNPLKTQGPKDDWGVFKNTLGLSQEKGKFLNKNENILNFD